jgi:O-6-methylguanine DNA methyltransferase
MKATRKISSPLGSLVLEASLQGLTRIAFSSANARDLKSLRTKGDLQEQKLRRRLQEHLDLAERELEAYFSGQLTQFSVSLDVQGGTDFQREVWQALSKIPYAQTWSYKDLAHHVKRPKAMRAVGSANGRNPLPIIIPCHRVIAADGGIGGYGGGLERKRKLLAIEQFAFLPA